MPQDLIYIPNTLEMTERAHQIAQSESLIEVFVSTTASIGSKGLNVMALSVNAYFRKPGETSDDLKKANSVYVSGSITNHEEVFGTFEEKVQALLNAYHVAAA